MVQTLTVKCPQCHQVAEIFLSTNACVIILNCPSCYSPIMYFDQKIFILSQHQVEAIKNKAHGSAAMNMLNKIAQPEQLPIKKTASCEGEQQHADAYSVPPRAPSMTSPSTQKIQIGADDITNLRIDLALCNDVQDFINKM